MQFLNDAEDIVVVDILILNLSANGAVIIETRGQRGGGEGDLLGINVCWPEWWVTFDNKMSQLSTMKSFLKVQVQVSWWK